MPPPVIPSHLPPHRLLLVDDDPVLLETLTDLLRHEGFAVSTAESGEGGIRMLQGANPPFDLVITDLVMPGKSGMDVLQKAIELNPGCTVLILSGFGTVREATEAMDQGAYGMITKPMHLDQFRNMLRRIMERVELIHERDSLRQEVKALRKQVEELEATKGRMEMLAGRLNMTENGSSVLSDLERLADLRERKVLSEEQFETTKKAMLARLK